jgi:hypothetical protein
MVSSDGYGTYQAGLECRRPAQSRRSLGCGGGSACVGWVSLGAGISMDADDYRKSADALGSMLDGAKRRLHFENICSEAVDYELRSQFGDDYSKGGLYGFLLQRMAKAASDYALPGNLDPRVFEETLLNEGLGIVRSLRWALVRDEKENPSPNFWDNNARPVDKIKAKQVPYIYRSGLEAVVGELCIPKTLSELMT